MGSTPKAPDYGQASREAIEAEIANLPARYNTELKYQPLFAQLETEQAASTARTMAETLLGINRDLGPEYTQLALDQLEQSNPEGMALRRRMFGIANDELDNLGHLTDAERREAEQSVRKAQASRGNVLGDGAAFVEAMEVGDAGYRKKQQQLATAGAIMSGQTPTAQFSDISGAQQGAAPFMPVSTGAVLNPNTGANGANFAANIYSTQAQTANPWMEALGTGLGIFAGKTWG